MRGKKKHRRTSTSCALCQRFAAAARQKGKNSGNGHGGDSPRVHIFDSRSDAGNATKKHAGIVAWHAPY